MQYPDQQPLLNMSNGQMPPGPILTQHQIPTKSGPQNYEKLSVKKMRCFGGVQIVCGALAGVFNVHGVHASFIYRFHRLRTLDGSFCKYILII
jgi:hypothetical protein